MRSDRRPPLRGSVRNPPTPDVGRETPQGVETSPDREQEVERLYRTEGARIWRALVAYSGDREVANDAMAEAFAQVLARGEAVREPLPWLWRSSFRIAAGELNARRRTTPLAQEGTYEMPEPIADVVRALARISPKQRAALILHDYADLPTSEIARIMGIARTTVRVHVSQARRRLRTLLEVGDA
jgi:RNA polymerase sigma-70 factor, ECF subfamily